MNKLSLLGFIAIFGLICNVAEAQNTQNPCMGATTGSMFPFTGDSTKFLVCMDGGRVSVQSCPSGLKWDIDSKKCLPDMNRTLRDLRLNSIKFLKTVNGQNSSTQFILPQICDSIEVSNAFIDSINGQYDLISMPMSENRLFPMYKQKSDKNFFTIIVALRDFWCVVNSLALDLTGQILPSKVSNECPNARCCSMLSDIHDTKPLYDPQRVWISKSSDQQQKIDSLIKFRCVPTAKKQLTMPKNSATSNVFLSMMKPTLTTPVEKETSQTMVSPSTMPETVSVGRIDLQQTPITTELPTNQPATLTQGVDSVPAPVEENRVAEVPQTLKNLRDGQFCENVVITNSTVPQVNGMYVLENLPLSENRLHPMYKQRSAGSLVSIVAIQNIWCVVDASRLTTPDMKVFPSTVSNECKNAACCMLISDLSDQRELFDASRVWFWRKSESIVSKDLTIKFQCIDKPMAEFLRRNFKIALPKMADTSVARKTVNLLQQASSQQSQFQQPMTVPQTMVVPQPTLVQQPVPVPVNNFAQNPVAPQVVTPAVQPMVVPQGSMQTQQTFVQPIATQQPTQFQQTGFGAQQPVAQQVPTPVFQQTFGQTAFGQPSVVPQFQQQQFNMQIPQPTVQQPVVTPVVQQPVFHKADPVIDSSVHAFKFIPVNTCKMVMCPSDYRCVEATCATCNPTCTSVSFMGQMAQITCMNALCPLGTECRLDVFDRALKCVLN